jgi:hypothetical protein
MNVSDYKSFHWDFPDEEYEQVKKEGARKPARPSLSHIMADFVDAKLSSGWRRLS